MGGGSGAIAHTGSGHSLTTITDPLFAAYRVLQPHGGLNVTPGNTLALVGNTLSLTGGLVAAPGGQIDLVSLSNGQVSLMFPPQPNPNSQLLTATPHQNSTDFASITLSQRALVDVSGPITGSINVYGSDVRLLNGAVIWGQNRGLVAAGNITVRAANSLQLSGQITQGAMLSSIMNSTVGPGAAGNVVVHTPQLTVVDGSSLGSRTFLSTGSTGQVMIDTRNLTVSGYAAGASNIFSRVGTFTAGAGSANTVTVDTTNLAIRGGGYLGSATVLAPGNGGNVVVTARDIDIMGATPTGELSLLIAASLAGSGNSGNLTIHTERLNVTSSGSVITSSFSDGSAGIVDITATDRIHVGSQLSGVRRSTISSAVTPAPLIYQQLLGGALPPPTGDAGEVKIRTGTLQIDEGGLVNVANAGSGQAGTLDARTQHIFLNGGDISAVTASGQGGDISLQAETLKLSQGSTIQATSFGLGNGGNIEIDSRFILGQQNSDIVANAVNGNGGNISITTQGLYGLQFRNQLTPQSDITASSEFGLEGSVNIANVGHDVSSGLVQLPAYFSDADNQVVASCSSDSRNRFVASGRGGLAVSPAERVGTNRPWQDVRSLHALHATDLATNLTTETGAPPIATTDSLQEAIGWQQTPTGEIELLTGRQLSAVSANCLRHGQSRST